MGYVNFESAKEMVRMRLFEKSCHYLKKLQFSKIGRSIIVKYFFFLGVFV